MFNFTMISQDDDQRIASIDYVKLTQYHPTPWTINVTVKGEAECGIFIIPGFIQQPTAVLP